MKPWSLILIICLSMASIGCLERKAAKKDAVSKTPVICPDKLMDARDGKEYKTVRIGDQCWMAENLNYKTSGGSWVYDNDEANGDIYGRLYDWETAMKVCPSGWHLPDDEEWMEMVDYLGSRGIAGGKLKEAGTVHWQPPNDGATNESGFTALPSGYRTPDVFGGLGWSCGWLSSTVSPEGAAHWNMDDRGNAINTHYIDKEMFGESVRCIKDQYKVLI